MSIVSERLERHFGWLTRLRRNRAGNTLAMLAIGILPLAGLVGGAVDMSRMYLTKTRLQQACDAGALAGRKAMGGGIWSQDSYAPRTIAEQFFDGNFQEGDYGTLNRDKEYNERAGKVTGEASAEVPMTLMQIFKRGTQKLTVTCEADMRLPNTDVMFVLDTTGSMGETLSGDNKTKMAGLKIAVNCFYEIVARLNTKTVCEGGDPSGGTGDQVEVRFGFVPFSTNVNVGRLLPSEWFADEWSYQSRQQTIRYGRRYGTDTSYDEDDGAWREHERSTRTSTSNCTARRPATPTAETSIGTPTDAVSWRSIDWKAYQQYGWQEYKTDYNSSTKLCVVSVRDVTQWRLEEYTETPSTSANAKPFRAWRYAQTNVDLRALKNGDGWNAGLNVPVGDGFTNEWVPWEGCIEERQTVARSSYAPIDSIKASAIDLDIDRTPDGAIETQWRPALGRIIYPSKSTYQNTSAWDRDPITTFTDYSSSYDRDDGKSGVSGDVDAACGTEGRKMDKWEDASKFEDYVNSLVATGNTYHDIGLLWGARLISPTGLFRAENEFTSKGGERERHVIFMTDGDACTGQTNYQAYGLSWFDRRTTTSPTYGCTTTGTVTQQVNARTAALCEATRNKNITLWVIWFGEKNTYIEDAMESCASTDKFFSARDSKELQKTFRNIADQISQLRLTA